MSRGPTKRCFRDTCTRKAKVTHECTICAFTMRSCNFHHERGFTTLQQHVMTEHPAEYRAAKAAFEPKPKLGPTFDVGTRGAATPEDT